MIPSTVPTTIVAGTTVKFSRQFADYPASDGWAYKLFLAGPDPQEIDGEADEDEFSIEILASESAEYDAGFYKYSERVSKADDVYQVGTGTIEVQADIAEVAAGDYRTHARKVLAAIEAVIERRATKDQESYTIGGRTLQRTPIGDLLDLRDRYRREVALAEAPPGVDPRRIGIRFRNA